MTLSTFTSDKYILLEQVQTFTGVAFLMKDL